MSGWYFRPRQKGETIREPVHGEFFNQDAISEPGKALVREGIQNALDAGLENGCSCTTPIRVRIYLSEDKESLSPDTINSYTHGAVEHLTAKRNGLNPENSKLYRSKCKFLVFEDFNTCGLTGDHTESFEPQTGKNHFYHFFRAEGQSDKGKSSRGSWGVGKHVFIRTSKISTIFGITVRSTDSARFLMGKCLLKSHFVGDDYCQDGYFGIRDKEHLVLPEDDSASIDTFSKLFKLSRVSETGLSLVVLWPEEEITSELLMKAVIQDYFYPILSNQLEVSIETPNENIIIDTKSLNNYLTDSEYWESFVEKTHTYKFKAIIKLAIWSKQCSEDDVIETNLASWSSTWSQDMFSKNQIEVLKTKYNSNEVIAVKVPMMFKKRGVDQEQSWFSVFLVKSSTSNAGRPIFIRDGIIISEVDAPVSRSAYALVVAEDSVITEMLRKAENPSHTQWDHTRLRNDYFQGYRKSLEFIKRSVCELIRLITESDKKKDTTLLADLFPSPIIPKNDDFIKSEQPKKSKNSGHKSSSPDIPDFPKERLSKVNIVKRQGGFSVLPGNDQAIVGNQISIFVAYDVRKGSPLKKYMPSDFIFQELDINLKNMNVIKKEDNQFVAIITKFDFELNIGGFDTNRQIYVRTRIKELNDDSLQI